jgi:hypothetical protein
MDLLFMPKSVQLSLLPILLKRQEAIEKREFLQKRGEVGEIGKYVRVLQSVTATHSHSFHETNPVTQKSHIQADDELGKKGKMQAQASP